MAIASEERLGSDRRRRDKVNQGEQREGLSSVYRFKACSSANSPRCSLTTENESFLVRTEMRLLTLYECNVGVSFQQLTVITACRRTTYTRNIGRVQIDQ